MNQGVSEFREFRRSFLLLKAQRKGKILRQIQVINK